MEQIEQVADAGQRIGGLQFEPLSIRRSAQLCQALEEKLGAENAALFTTPLRLSAAAAATVSQIEISESMMRAQFDQVVREHVDTVLEILSEFSGHSVQKLEKLRPSEIRLAFEVLLDLPT